MLDTSVSSIKSMLNLKTAKNLVAVVSVFKDIFQRLPQRLSAYLSRNHDLPELMHSFTSFADASSFFAVKGNFQFR